MTCEPARAALLFVEVELAVLLTWLPVVLVDMWLVVEILPEPFTLVVLLETEEPPLLVVETLTAAA